MREYGQAGMPGFPAITMTVDITDEAATAVPAERRAELVQVLREAMANAIRHGRPRNLSIAGTVEHGRLKLSVADDGAGFDVNAGSTEEHHGLRNMANRARMLDGHLHIDSTPGSGTVITLDAPISV
jgi:signal transduction histidine kinase